MRLLLACLFLASTSLMAGTPHLQGTRELGLSGFQEDLISRDAPLTNITLSPDARTAYVLGKTHVWLWQPEKRSLHRVKIPRSGHDGQCTHLEAVSEKSTMLVCDGSLYLIDFEPLRLLRLKPPALGESHGFGLAQGKFYWLHDSGIFSTALNEPGLRREFSAGLFQHGDLARYDASSKTAWIARGPLLLKKTLHNQKVKSDAVHKAAEDFIGLAIVEDEVWAHTRTTVLRFDHLGNLRSVIPVEGRRFLANAHFTPKQHVYLFEDGLLEVYDLANETRRAYRLEKNWDKASDLASEGPLTAFLRDGKPALFLLE